MMFPTSRVHPLTVRDGFGSYFEVSLNRRLTMPGFALRALSGNIGSDSSSVEVATLAPENRGRPGETRNRGNGPRCCDCGRHRRRFRPDSPRERYRAACRGAHHRKRFPGNGSGTQAARGAPASRIAPRLEGNKPRAAGSRPHRRGGRNATGFALNWDQLVAPTEDIVGLTGEAVNMGLPHRPRRNPNRRLRRSC